MSRARRLLALVLGSAALAGAAAAPAVASCDERLCGVPSTPSLLASAAGLPPAPGTQWSADFSTDDFSQWSWWGQGERDWGHVSVVPSGRARVPALASRYVARMAVTRADARNRRYHAKLYKAFTRPTSDGTQAPPEDVSGTYSAWFYVPSGYRLPRTGWSNVFQFKEQYGERSDPLWWIQLGSARWARGYQARHRWVTRRPPRNSSRPVAFVNFWGNRWKRPVDFAALPLDRWFEIRAVVRQGKQISFYVDGRLLDTGYAWEYPVNPFRAGSRNWTFGVGNYTTAPGTVLYVGAARYVDD